MDKQQLNLLDLPDEILLMIFKELNTVDVLYFVANVNQRLNYITHDYLFVRQLDLTGLSTIKDRCNEHLADEQVLSHLCQNILGRIHYQMHRLTLEPYFNERYYCCCQLSSTLFFIASKFSRQSSSSVFHRCIIQDTSVIFERVLFPFLSILKTIHFYIAFANELHIFVSMSKKSNCSTTRRSFPTHSHWFCPYAINWLI